MLWEELHCVFPCDLCDRGTGQVLWHPRYYVHYGNDGLERRMARRMELYELEF